MNIARWSRAAFEESSGAKLIFRLISMKKSKKLLEIWTAHKTC